MEQKKTIYCLLHGNVNNAAYYMGRKILRIEK